MRSAYRSAPARREVLREQERETTVCLTLRGQRTHVADAVCIADWTRGWRKMVLAGNPHGH